MKKNEKESNINNLQNLLDVLKPIKLAVEALCRREVNIITADVILNSLRRQISSINTSLGKTMFESPIYRIGERRDIKLYTLTKYLKDPEIFNKNM